MSDAMELQAALDHARAFKARLVTPFEKLESVLAAAVIADVKVKDAQATVDRLTQEAASLRTQMATDLDTATAKLETVRANSQAEETDLARRLEQARQDTAATLAELAETARQAQADHDQRMTEFARDEAAATAALVNVQAKLEKANRQLMTLRAKLE